MKEKKSGWNTTPDKRAPGFPEKDYKESLEGGPKGSGTVGSGSKTMGPNDQNTRRKKS